MKTCTRVVTTLPSYILDAQWQLTFGGWVWRKIKLIQTFMEVLVTYKWGRSIQVLEWSQKISHCKSMQIFYDAQWKLTPESKVGSTLN